MLSNFSHLAKEAMKPVVASALFEYRKKRNLTQEAMAKRFPMSLRSYIDLEHGVNLPSATSLAQFLLMLNPTEQEILLEQLREVLEESKTPQKTVD